MTSNSVLAQIFLALWHFHTADVFAALVRPSIWSRHVIVRYNLFGLFAYSAISVAEHLVHPYLWRLAM